MKNIHILPTDKPSRLYEDVDGDLQLGYDFIVRQGMLQNQNIYITSDEEIKDGDWMIRGNEQPIKVTKDFFWDFGVRYYKIILTTDQDLIKDGVQAIGGNFLEWFIQNPNCEEVEINKVIWNAVNDFEYKIIIPKEEPKKVLTEEDIFNQKDIDAVTDYINKEQQKQHLIDMMKDGEELGLYDDIKANRTELICKDCSDSLEDCTCIEDTIDFPRQEIKLEDVFNDEKKENIKKFIDEINNPSQPNDKLKQAFEKYSEYLEDFENKNTYEHGFKDGAKCQQEIMYSEEEVIAFGEFIFKHSLLTHTRGVKSLFEQFKKK